MIQDQNRALIKRAIVDAIAVFDMAIMGTEFTKPVTGRLVLHKHRAETALASLRGALEALDAPRQEGSADHDGAAMRHTLSVQAAKNPLQAEGAPAGERARHEGWRCFQCDELFMDERAAVGHFGRWSHHSPACMAGETFQGLKTAYNHLEADFYAMKSRAEAAEAALSPPAAEGKEEVCWRCGGERCIQEGSPEAWNYTDCPECKASGKLSKTPAPAAEPVGYRMLQRDGSVLNIQTAPYHAGFAEMMAKDCGCVVRPVYDTPQQPVAISREDMMAVVRRFVAPAWCSVDQLVDAILAKMKPNLKEEGGLSRSQPCGDAQERSHDPQHSGGGEG